MTKRLFIILTTLCMGSSAHATQSSTLEEQLSERKERLKQGNSKRENTTSILKPLRQCKQPTQKVLTDEQKERAALERLEDDLKKAER